MVADNDKSEHIAGQMDDIVLYKFDGSEMDRLAYLSWDIMIEDPASKHRVSHAVLNGTLPKQVRHKLWMHASGAETLKGRNAGTYSKLLGESLNDLEEKKIQRDLRRTFGTILSLPSYMNIDQSISSLYKVLKVLCLYDDIAPCTYCQGLNYIVAALLVEATPPPFDYAGDGGSMSNEGPAKAAETKARVARQKKEGADIGGRVRTRDQGDGTVECVEEDVFWLAACLVHKRHIGCLLRTDLPYLPEYLQTFSTILKVRMPELHLHLAKESFTLTSFAVEWFTCLFTFSHPRPFVSFVFDLIFTDHPDVLFAVALSLLKLSEKDLLKMSFEEMILGFRPLTQKHRVEDVRELLTWTNLRSRTLERLTQQLGMREVARYSESESPFFHNSDGHFPPRLLDFLKRANGMTVTQCQQLFVHEFEILDQGLGTFATKQLATEALYRCCWWDAVVPAVAILQSGLCGANCCLKMKRSNTEEGKERNKYRKKNETNDQGEGKDYKARDLYVTPLHLCAIRNAVNVSRVEIIKAIVVNN